MPLISPLISLSLSFFIFNRIALLFIQGMRVWWKGTAFQPLHLQLNLQKISSELFIYFKQHRINTEYHAHIAIYSTGLNSQQPWRRFHTDGKEMQQHRCVLWLIITIQPETNTFMLPITNLSNLSTQLSMNYSGILSHVSSYILIFQPS